MGAGTGLCGIAALNNNAKNVIFTDIDDPRIERNLRKNCSINNVSSFAFLPCDWNEIPNAVLEKSFDLILASDCLFESRGT